MYRTISIAIVLAAALAGCGEEAFWKKPVEPQQPAPPSKEQILAEVKPAIEPFRDVLRPMPDGGRGPGLTGENRDKVINALRDAQIKYGNTDNGPAALREVGAEIAEIARKARDDDRWVLVQACVDAYEILNMKSVALERLDNRAKEILSRPTVEVKGFLDDKETGVTNVFLELTNRDTKEVKRITAREGDEFDNLRLVEIIGNNKAVRFEYLAIPGLFFEVEGVSYWSRK